MDISSGAKCYITHNKCKLNLSVSTDLKNVQGMTCLLSNIMYFYKQWTFFFFKKEFSHSFGIHFQIDITNFTLIYKIVLFGFNPTVCGWPHSRSFTLLQNIVMNMHFKFYLIPSNQSFLNKFHTVSWCIILLKEATAIRGKIRIIGVYWVCSNV